MIKNWIKKINGRAAGFVFVVLLALLLFFTGLDNLKNGHRREGKEQLEAAIRRSAVACYAAEGIYPPTIEYLEEHYGIQIDGEKYIVMYEIFADNLMPEITVLEKDYEGTY